MRDRLSDERHVRNWSQKTVAEYLYISEVYVRKLEKGTRNPGRELMLKFEKLYSVSAKDLFPDLFEVNFDTKCIKRNSA